MVPGREIFWNIPYGAVILYPTAAVVVLAMVYAVYRRTRLWHTGKPENRTTPIAPRIRAFLATTLVDGFAHRRFFGVADNLGHRPLTASDLKPKEFYPGLAHFLIFVGCIIFLMGTISDVISHHFIEFLHGNVYLVFTVVLNTGGVLAIIGVILSVLRRYQQRPSRLDNQPDDLVALLLILVVVLTGFLIQALRLAETKPPWAAYSFVGYLFSQAFAGVSSTSLLFWHRATWWIHAALALGSMVYISFYFSRLWHIVISPANVYFRNLEPRGALAPIDMERAESFGVSRIQDFSWKHLMDLDACTRCGRCEDNCPASLTDKPLSPKKVVQDLKKELLDKAPALLQAKASAPAATDPPAEPRPIAGGVIQQDEIWNCTTCFACQEACPVWIEPMVKIVEMRRNLVLEQALIPETAEGALRSMEARGHPWRGTTATRTDWANGLGVRTLSEDSNIEVLYWVGCTAALEERSMKTARAIAQVMQLAGVSFGILGTEESCCGDPARRLGNEYLYQMLVAKNIEVFKQYSIKQIVTGCPHCYNTLKHEYPQFGGNYQVTHYTGLIDRLLAEGRLKLTNPRPVRTTYHDSCYLGRYNDIYDEPRRILARIPGLSLVEMERRRERGFCCGAGGGHLWLEEQRVSQRISEQRTEQATAVNAELIATACPYCLQMFEDGIKSRGTEDSLRVMDIAELVAESARKGG